MSRPHPAGPHPAGPGTILGLDAAGASCSAALWTAGGIRARRVEAMARGQSERLVPLIEEVMAEAGMSYGELDAIAVTRGPGGFTGVRIGLAAARGLGLALARPVIGITSFEAMAAAVPEVPPGRVLVVAIEAKRAEIYVQAFRAPRRGSGPGGEPAPAGPGMALRPEDLDDALPAGPLWLTGDAARRAAPALRAAGRVLDLVPGAEDCMAALAVRLAAGRDLAAAGDGDAPRPIYLRGPDVTLPDRRKVQTPDRRGARIEGASR